MGIKNLFERKGGGEDKERVLDREAEKKARDLVERYGLSKATIEAIPPDIREVLNAIKDPGRVILRVSLEQFQRIIEGENVKELFEDKGPPAGGGDEWFYLPHDFWFFVDKVRVATKARHGDNGFIDNVVYPSSLAMIDKEAAAAVAADHYDPTPQHIGGIPISSQSIKLLSPDEAKKHKGTIKAIRFGGPRKP